MASGGTARLTTKDIICLAEAIAAKHMEEIAMLYFDIDWEEVENSKKEHREDVKAFNRDMLRKWAYKNSGPNQAQVTSHTFELWLLNFYFSNNLLFVKF